MSAEGRIVSVNVGVPRTVSWQGRQVTTAIFKEPVSERRKLVGVNVIGDEQADRRVHGGPSKAVYAYSDDDYRWWTQVLRRELRPGTFGENLTTAGLDLTQAVVGERWRVGGATLRVTEPRLPCFKLGLRMSDVDFPARFTDAHRPGTYLAIEREGDVGSGDDIVVLERPDHGLSVGAVVDAYHGDPVCLAYMIDNPHLSPEWLHWATRARARRS
jgi:MOSC domain-containing protein YiiM